MKKELRNSMIKTAGYLVMSVMLTVFFGYVWETYLLLMVPIAVYLLNDLDKYLDLRREEIVNKIKEEEEKITRKEIFKKVDEINVRINEGFTSINKMRNELIGHFSNEKDIDFIIDVFNKQTDNIVNKITNQ